MEKARDVHVTVVRAEKTSKSWKLEGYIRDAFGVVKVLAAVLVIIFACVHWKDITQLLRKIRHVEALGVKVDLAAAANVLKENRKGPRISDTAATKAVRRAVENVERFRTATILWIDDHPENNRTFQRLLHELGSQVIVAFSTSEARDAWKRTICDVVISDIRRDNREDEDPVAFAREISSGNTPPYVIFFVFNIDERAKPPGSFGFTNRPDELLNLITDALERGPMIASDADHLAR